MRHWVEELSNREENLTQKHNLGLQAYRRLLAGIEQCLEIYNERHKGSFLKPDTSDDGRLMTITVSSNSAQVYIAFRAGTPNFTWENQPRDQEAPVTRELYVDDYGKMFVSSNGNRFPLEDAVRRMIQPVLFPGLPVDPAEGPQEYYVFLGF